MKSAVYFIDLRATAGKSFVEKLGRLVDAAGLSDTIKTGDLTAVKLHFGELGNTAASIGTPPPSTPPTLLRSRRIPT